MNHSNTLSKMTRLTELKVLPS